jgi:phosphohistidine phosphatase SixA
LIVIVLRHADRQPDPVDDLTPAGRERAELLARMLAESGVTAAFHSGAERARLTLVQSPETSCVRGAWVTSAGDASTHLRPYAERS